MLCLSVYYSLHVCLGLVFFFKQKTAYEMRISDWSSDVCSSDLTKPIHSLATLKAQTPPSLYPSINGARGGGTSPGAAALVGGVVGVALGAGAVFVKRKIGRASCRERVCQYV